MWLGVVVASLVLLLRLLFTSSYVVIYLFILFSVENRLYTCSREKALGGMLGGLTCRRWGREASFASPCWMVTHIM